MTLLHTSFQSLSLLVPLHEDGVILGLFFTVRSTGTSEEEEIQNFMCNIYFDLNCIYFSLLIEFALEIMLVLPSTSSSLSSASSGLLVSTISPSFSVVVLLLKSQYKIMNFYLNFSIFHPFYKCSFPLET